MMEIDLRRVTFLNEGTPQESLERLHRAASASGVSDGAIRALVLITAVAHHGGKLPDIHHGHLSELQKLGLVHLPAPGTEIRLA
ncbi:hypothetical protein [Streptomyces sp. 5-10]|uniref:hypothetical protein n=1 Tax=Streptomyces sp. 5-10 TaxID=878925 RepID=UPI00168AD087|nr:hypothetical protein [Streptomyces sp. 5-10]MBD3004840.1 hypothetical protein [Streptomyces sp. 5-10]